MKKFFRMLLLAAVALMPVMGMAQDNDERDYAWERQMRSQQYADSVKAAQQKAEFEHEQNMTQLKSSQRQSMINQLWDRDYIGLFICAGGIVTIVVLCLRHSRKKAEDHKDLINKLIDNNLLNSTETISKETIEALMNPKSKKSEKERFIGDATLLGLGIGMLLGATPQHQHNNEELIFVGAILAGLGLFRLIIRTTTTIIERKNAKNKVEEDPESGRC